MSLGEDHRYHATQTLLTVDHSALGSAPDSVGFRPSTYSRSYTWEACWAKRSATDLSLPYMFPESLQASALVGRPSFRVSIWLKCVRIDANLWPLLLTSQQIAPRPIRGLVTVQYACCQQLGVVFGFFINYGVTKHYKGTNVQWMLPTALQLLPAAVWFVGTMFTVESPRYLFAANRREKAMKNLVRLRNLPETHPVIVVEVAAIETQLLHEAEEQASTSQLGLWKETLGSVENRRRFALMFGMHVFGQWSGANAITQYSPTIFGYVSPVNKNSSVAKTLI